MVRKLLLGTVLLLLLMAVAFLALRCPAVGRLVPPDQAAIARRGQPIAQAIHEFKNQCGLWPLSLDELVPSYLPAKPDGLWLWDHSLLCSFAGLPHTGVCYDVAHPENGWYSTGDFGKGGLNVPGPTTTRPSLPPEQLHANTIAELSSRIRREPDQLSRQQDQINYFVYAKRLAEARLACAECIAVFPHHWWPQLALAALAPDGHEQDTSRALEAWMQSHPSFHNYWYLAWHYRTNGRLQQAIAALREAVKYPLVGQNEDTRIPEFFAYDAAVRAYEAGEWQLVLDICNTWESLKAQGGCPEESYHAMRAAAQLKLGLPEEARRNAESALQANARHATWAGGLQALRQATREGNREFKYVPGRCCGDDLELFNWNQ